LDLLIGVFNTLVLLLSSWSVARCVQSARAGAYRPALKDAFLTAFFGLEFMKKSAGVVMSWVCWRLE
jgi:nitric oxide reductase NorE protein